MHACIHTDRQMDKLTGWCVRVCLWVVVGLCIKCSDFRFFALLKHSVLFVANLF